jgi:hypothetical protein
MRQGLIQEKQLILIQQSIDTSTYIEVGTTLDELYVAIESNS